MDDVDVIEAYVRELERRLRRAGRPTEPLVEEARAHLFEDAARIAHAERCDDVEAARRAIARFGGVADVVAASRRYGRTLAASVARVTSPVVLAVLAWYTLTDFLDPWPATAAERCSWLLFVVELTVMTVSLLRALARGRAGRILRIAVPLNGAVAAALVVGQTWADGVATQFRSARIFDAADPLLVLMIVQAVAAVRALRQQATQVGQPSLPVEWQPPG
ncbi:MAG TPA: hypothetical protein VF334_21060 [Polyangia bacterium]